MIGKKNACHDFGRTLTGTKVINYAKHYIGFSFRYQLFFLNSIVEPCGFQSAAVFPFLPSFIVKYSCSGRVERFARVSGRTFNPISQRFSAFSVLANCLSGGRFQAVFRLIT
jgi:hypothetical protein